MSDQPAPKDKPVVAVTTTKDRTLLAQMAATIASTCSKQNELLAAEVGVRVARMILDKIDQGA